MSASFYLLDGVFISATEPGLFPSNRGFRYGEGLFETMRYQHGRIALWHYHWERLRAGMALLGLEPPVHWGPEQILEKCLQLVRKNKCGTAARLRLTVCPGEGGLWETPRPAFRWVVECWKAEPLLHLHENGLDLGVFDGGYKSCDPLSNLKSANYLLYAQAARYAKTQHWNECLVLNQHNRIADATIANLFYVKAGTVYTPALREGGVAGVMRRYLLEQMPAMNIAVEETACSPSDLLAADELFLTNAFYGIRWVKQFGDASLRNLFSSRLFAEVVKPLFA